MFRLALFITLLIWPHSVHQDDAAHYDGNDQITVAVASSLTLPLEDIARHFEDKFNTEIALTSASSGVLTAQIIHGAPYDVFVSADIAYPEKLHRLKKTLGSTQIIALGSLVLWSKTDFEEEQALYALANKNVRSLAIANPELAPFGVAAIKWLKEKKLYEKLQSKLIYGENIGSINQFIASEAVDMALTSISAHSASQLREKGYWHKIAASEISGIPHGAVAIKQDHSEEAAQKFLRYLFSKNAQQVFGHYGYINPKKDR
ncbi:molybdate ABC transporter substrate-binding protein [Fodinibius salsisoli]|uniref:Molybdate ABC transporter substrate-binding protein n=1 Tax=Fodinibius salsisoli TaxID=2820877 RepID=A0ABT3PTK0_9BACT|nr:molybdate ABC transporter substrate-binding protein [Fodinibius salsisoli]MCW9709167.1 molybdate ABC transporter substrate-binding protein [Fodinibius salsisoli]